MLIGNLQNIIIIIVIILSQFKSPINQLQLHCLLLSSFLALFLATAMYFKEKKIKNKKMVK